MAKKQYKIIDLSTLLPGPLTTSLLSDNNITVYKYEDIRNPDPMRQMWPTKKGISVTYQNININKKIITYDSRSDNDLKKLKNELTIASVVVENYKTGRLDKIGLGYNQIRKINPSIIYCSITGFGPDHPLSNLPAHDLNVLAISGYFYYSDNFVIPSLPIADLFTSYYASLKILKQIIKAENGHLQISMLDAVSQASAFLSSIESFLSRSIKKEEFILWGSYPCYHLYQTKDNRYMALAAIETIFWSDFCNELNLPNLINCQFDKSQAVINQISNSVKLQTQKYWSGKKIATFTPVLSYTESKINKYVK